MEDSGGGKQVKEAATGGGKLPRELVVKILVLCPLQDLARFRSVSPFWRNLIESNGFATMHVKYSIQHNRDSSIIALRKRPYVTLPGVNLSYGLWSVDFYPLSPIARPISHPIQYNQPGRTRIYGSVNGILLLLYGDQFGYPRCGRPEGDVLLLWNPATHKHLVLPDPHLPPPDPSEYERPDSDSDSYSDSEEDVDYYAGHVDAVWTDSDSGGSGDDNLDSATDPGSYSCLRPLAQLHRVLAICFGLAYDSPRDDYILLRLVAFALTNEGGETYKTQAQVFSLKSNLWTRIADPPHYIPVADPAVFVSGRFHWIVSEKLGDECEFGSVLSLHPFTEAYTLVPLPIYLRQGGFWKLSVVEFERCLSVLCCSADGIFDMWVLRDYDNTDSWTNLLSISQPVPDEMQDYKLFYPLALSETLEEILMSQDGKKLFWFNLLAKTITLVPIEGLPKRFYPFVYVASFIPLGENAQDDEQVGQLEL